MEWWRGFLQPLHGTKCPTPGVGDPEGGEEGVGPPAGGPGPLVPDQRNGECSTIWKAMHASGHWRPCRSRSFQPPWPRTTRGAVKETSANEAEHGARLRRANLGDTLRLLSQNGDRAMASRIAEFPFVRVTFEFWNSNLHNSTLDLTRPPTQGPRLGEGGPKLLWPQFIKIICSLQQFQGPHSPTRASTRPPS